MNVRTREKVPTIAELTARFPITDELKRQVMRDRSELRNILSGKDDRFIVIVGPCSAWPSPAVLSYAGQLASLEKILSDRLKIVMRVYTQKPRTTTGWTGPAIQPDPFTHPDMAVGLRHVRSLMSEVVSLGLAISDEALFPHVTRGTLDLLSWVAIGARSTEDQERRIFASALDLPVGMKNPTSGSIGIGVNSIIAAQHRHAMVMDGLQIETNGNEHAHLVLRGGETGPNYSRAHIEQAATLLNRSSITNPAIIVDASHDNCRDRGKKDPHRMIDVVKSVLGTRKENVSHNWVKGIMLESFLQTGNQCIDGKRIEEVDMTGLSITDPCLGWQETETLLRYIHTHC